MVRRVRGIVVVALAAAVVAAPVAESGCARTSAPTPAAAFATHQASAPFHPASAPFLNPAHLHTRGNDLERCMTDLGLQASLLRVLRFSACDWGLVAWRLRGAGLASLHRLPALAHLPCIRSSSVGCFRRRTFRSSSMIDIRRTFTSPVTPLLGVGVDVNERRRRVLREPDLPALTALLVAVAAFDVNCVPAVGTEVAAQLLGHLNRRDLREQGMDLTGVSIKPAEPLWQHRERSNKLRLVTARR